jgi:hypothetical protein
LNATVSNGSNIGGSLAGNITTVAGGTTSGISGLYFTSSSTGSQTGTFTVNDSNATNSGQTGSVTVNVLGHSNAAWGTITGNNQTVITGGSLTATLNLTNIGTGISALDVGGLVNLTGGTVGSGVIAANSSAAYTASWIAGSAGTQTEAVSLMAGDQQTLSGHNALSTLSQNLTYTVLNHASGSLSNASYTYNVLKGAQNVTGTSTTLLNAAGNYAGLQITSVTGGLSGVSVGNIISAGGNAALSTAAIDTSNYGTSSTTYTINFSDDQSIAGWTNSTMPLTYKVYTNVGYATADASGSGTGTYGTALTASVAAKGSYDGLASQVTSTANGSLKSLGTQATILYGANASSSAQTVSMAWRTRTSTESAATNATPLVSDVVNVSGMTTSGSSQSSPFLLEMTFDPNNLKYGANSLSTCIANDNIYIVSNAAGQWENTVLENTGGTAKYMGLSDPNALSISDSNIGTYLGDYGVWTSTSGDYAWAVVNHNSEFAVIPEPSTLGLLVAGFLSLIAYAWRKRRN